MKRIQYVFTIFLLVTVFIFSACEKEGPAGPAGATGAQGPAGPTGPIGPQGSTGTANVIYSRWTNGSTWTAVQAQDLYFLISLRPL
jgi:hypothetical protein